MLRNDWGWGPQGERTGGGQREGLGKMRDASRAALPRKAFAASERRLSRSHGKCHGGRNFDIHSHDCLASSRNLF
jgi:hypothetical protein